MINKKELKPGMLCQWLEHSTSPADHGAIVRSHLVRLVEHIAGDGWYVKNVLTGVEGGGWQAWELFPYTARLNP